MTTTEFTPLYDHVLVEPVEIKSTSLIITPDTIKGHPTHGVVKATGGGYLSTGGEKIVPLTVKIGDLVMFRKGDGMGVTLDKNYLIMKENQILGILKNKGK